MPLIPQTSGRYKPLRPGQPPGNSLAAAAKLPSTGGLYAGSTPSAPPAARPPAAPRKPQPAPQVPPGQVPKIAQQLTLEQQAQQTVTQLLQPLIDQITQASTARSTQGTAAIQGYADALAKELGAVNYAAPYQGAEQRQAAVDSSLASASSGQGLADANDLASRLAVINDPTVGVAAGAVQGNANANATTLLAQGSNSLRDLISNEASAKSYGLKQPGIAKLSGLQQIGQLQSTISTDQAAALSKLAAESPQLALSYLGQLRTQQNSDRTFKASNKKEAYQEWLGMQKFGQTQANQSFNEWYKQKQLGISQQNADTSSYNATHSKPGKLQHATVNGHAVTFDPNTGTYYVPGTTQPVNPGSLSKPAKVSTAALSKARGYLQSSAKGFYASQVDPAKPLTASQIASAAKAAGVTVQQFLADPKALAQAGIGWNQVTQKEDQHIQDLYVTLVKTYGIPARQAFDMVAGTYKNWGGARRGQYFPKAGAAESGVSVQGATAKDASAVALVQQYVGTPYVWGGAKPGGFDCSGLLQYVWAKNGVSIPRTTYQQWTAGRDVTGGQLQPGDAVFFTGSDPKNGKPGHVGMYIGNGRFVESPHTGASVRISTLSSRKDFVGARRFA